MTFKPIAWRTARARFPGVLICVACPAKCTSEGGQVEQWYVTDKNVGPYCPECAAKLANASDSSRSENKFFLTTRG